MNRQQKELVVQLLKERFAASPASFVIGYRGLSVDQMQKLRSKLREKGGVLKVAKARLMKRAIGDLGGSHELEPYLKDQIGLVFAEVEPPTVARVLRDYGKENEALQLIVGRLDDALIDSTGIVRIASLPSKEVQLAILAGTLKAPITSFVVVLKMTLMQLLFALKSIADKKK